VKEPLNGPVGVPDTNPDEDSESPRFAGPFSTVQVQPDPQPGADNCCEYETPTVACGKTGFVVIAKGFTTRVKPKVSDAPPLLTVTCGKKVSATEGVPESVPLLLRFIPDGSPDADHVYVPLPPKPFVNVKEEYAVPATPAGRVPELRMVKGETINVIAWSKVAPVLSATRTEVVYVPEVVVTPIRPPVAVEAKYVGSKGASWRRMPGIGVADGDQE
jgi:hypothetical protein